MGQRQLTIKLYENRRARIRYYFNQSINQSINPDISNAPANKISLWRARQTMDDIKKKNEKIINVQVNQEMWCVKFGKKERSSVCSFA